ncbi:MAG: hypothetical protein HC810_08180 [Acaryochloridaceae cyanobacterium RL_2_7]|nr:hypothetical protein [Acaryochloridaceae cyanobacterium RL_2_7]
MFNSSTKTVVRLVGAATLSSALVAAVAPLAQAQYQYSSQLVQQYNAGCSSKLQKKGFYC